MAAAHLQELLARPGNDRCADCSATRPRYASTTFGIFICQDCYAAHRNAGAHVSKTKSLAMDQWSTDDVIAMERGNVASNLEMEARLPTRQSTFGFPSADARSLFIHQKYRLKQWFQRAPNRTKQQHLDQFWIPSPAAPEAVPPPAPPARGDAVWFTNGPKAGSVGVIRVVVSKQGVDDEYIVKLKSGTTYKCMDRNQFSMKDPADLPPPVVDDFCSLSFEVEPARSEANNEPYVDALEDLLGLGLARIGRSHQASVNLRYGMTHK